MKILSAKSFNQSHYFNPILFLSFMKHKWISLGWHEGEKMMAKFSFWAKLFIWTDLAWLLDFWKKSVIYIVILPLLSSMLLMWERCRKEFRTLRNQLSLSTKKKPFTNGTKPHTQKWRWSRNLLSPIRSSSTWFWNGNAQERGLWNHILLIQLL